MAFNLQKTLHIWRCHRRAVGYSVRIFEKKNDLVGFNVLSRVDFMCVFQFTWVSVLYSCRTRNSLSFFIREYLCNTPSRSLSGVCWPQNHRKSPSVTCSSASWSLPNVLPHKATMACIWRSLTARSFTHARQSTVRPDCRELHSAFCDLWFPEVSWSLPLDILPPLCCDSFSSDVSWSLPVDVLPLVLRDSCSIEVPWSPSLDILPPVFCASCSPEVSWSLQLDLLPPVNSLSSHTRSCDSSLVGSSVIRLPPEMDFT